MDRPPGTSPRSGDASSALTLGSYQADCINVTATTQECTESLTVPGGHIAAQASYGQASTALTPIVGGSGSYVGARGDMSEREVHNGREVQLVLHLNP